MCTSKLNYTAQKNQSQTLCSIWKKNNFLLEYRFFHSDMYMYTNLSNNERERHSENMYDLTCQSAGSFSRHPVGNAYEGCNHIFSSSRPETQSPLFLQHVVSVALKRV
jgi:hypothetical protein